MLKINPVVVNSVNFLIRKKKERKKKQFLGSKSHRGIFEAEYDMNISKGRKIPHLKLPGYEMGHPVFIQYEYILYPTTYFAFITYIF